MALGPTAEPERLMRVKITAPGAVIAPRPGHFYAFPGETIEVDDRTARPLIARGWAELVEDAP